MNIVQLHNNPPREIKELGCLFERMEASLHSANADFEKSVRLAKTLAPILNDQTSNPRHLATIESLDASIQEKVIAILMLGFPKNRVVLPALQDVLHTGTTAMRMAAAIAIAQMRNPANSDVLSDILLTAFRQEKKAEVKVALRQALLAVTGKRSKQTKKIV